MPATPTAPGSPRPAPAPRGGWSRDPAPRPPGSSAAAGAGGSSRPQHRQPAPPWRDHPASLNRFLTPSPCTAGRTKSYPKRASRAPQPTGTRPTVSLQRATAYRHAKCAPKLSPTSLSLALWCLRLPHRASTVRPGLRRRGQPPLLTAQVRMAQGRLEWKSAPLVCRI